MEIIIISLLIISILINVEMRIHIDRTESEKKRLVREIEAMRRLFSGY